MQEDAAKLLEVATGLKQVRRQGGAKTYSPWKVMRKAEEMEKQARQIKTNMRGE
jgi:hypothetical protein